ncbi:MAG: endonuclease/exonuclease/phosphatase family protein, partial [Verrucomicrobiota bacterium]
RIWGLITGSAAFILLLTFLPYYISPKAPASEASFELVSYNLNTSNRRYRTVLQYLIDKDPDIVFLMEVDSKWVKKLATLNEKFPYRITHPREDNFGLLLMSKFHLSDGQIRDDVGSDVPSVSTSINIGEKSIFFLGAHPLPPYGRKGSIARNQQLSAFSSVITEMRSDYKILAGDLNTTPFSHHFKKLMKKASLRDSSLGHGFQPTWMRHAPWFAIPIDHILVSERLTVEERVIGDSMGSDHNPIFARISFSK